MLHEYQAQACNPGWGRTIWQNVSINCSSIKMPFLNENVTCVGTIKTTCSAFHVKAELLGLINGDFFPQRWLHCRECKIWDMAGKKNNFITQIVSYFIHLSRLISLIFQLKIFRYWWFERFCCRGIRGWNALVTHLHLGGLQEVLVHRSDFYDMVGLFTINRLNKLHLSN